MPTYLNLSELDRAQLENLLLSVHSAYVRTLQAVRENTKPGWAVRRAVDEIARETSCKPVFRRAFALYEERLRDARAKARHDQFWDGLTPPPHPPATPP